MSHRTIGIIVTIGGLAVALVFALADVIGVGTDPTVFGTRQIIGTLVGGVAFVLGLALITWGGRS